LQIIASILQNAPFILAVPSTLGLNCISPKFLCGKPLPLVPKIMTTLGDRAFKEMIKLNQFFGDVLIRGNLDLQQCITEAYTQRKSHVRIQ
jgi:hypothetical protein